MLPPIAVITRDQHAAPRHWPRDARLRHARGALSELFLDTALDEDDFEKLCRTLLDCDLSIAELERIYCDELAPILHINLKIPAGEWSGFDLDWLESEIRKRSSRWRIPFFTALRRRWILRETRPDWERLKRLLEAQPTPPT